MLDESVKQPSAELPSQTFIKPSRPSAELNVSHKNDATRSIPETKDQMEVDEVVEGPAAHDLNSSLYSDSLHRPPLWESSPRSPLWVGSSPTDLKVSSISGTQQKSRKEESWIPPVYTNIGLQTSFSRDSEDEMVLEKDSPGKYRTDK